MPRTHPIIYAVATCLFSWTLTANAAKQPVILSTDLALGLRSVQGETASYATNAAPQDCDDGLALAYMLNLKDEYDVRGVVVTYGNAPLAPELEAAKRLLDLKNRMDVPVLAGASAPLINPDAANATAWTINNETLPLYGDRKGQTGCVNPG
eukprot:CAMPEP_0203753326 /NCGR_PEP_ID=MMETSP0098-20131031/7114_1 /ASSEMBLY_ACC=CAM_ASM_000208 /TAXON_ID=96639 /ORGANISM=" , Strain NY0313808BC1" /LENGTH=151 /DNA_ID=CAMNT_0050643875 /DNA_START=1156 /DNA_END=1607 /DNA_ORIENTATION=-